MEKFKELSEPIIDPVLVLPAKYHRARRAPMKATKRKTSRMINMIMMIVGTLATKLFIISIRMRQKYLLPTVAASRGAAVATLVPVESPNAPRGVVIVDEHLRRNARPVIVTSVTMNDDVAPQKMTRVALL